MKRPFLIMLGSAAITAGLLLAPPANAEASRATETRTSLVQTSDLDLSSAAGQRKLDARLVHAAREVCGPVSDADLAGQNDLRRCLAGTIAAAKDQKDELIAARSAGRIIAVSAAR